MGFWVGAYDILSLCPVGGLRDTNELQIRINRRGTIQIHLDAPATFKPISWLEVLETNDPHVIVKRMEEHMGWTMTAQAAATNPATLTYRVMAQAHFQLMTEKSEWSVSMGFSASSGFGSSGENNIANSRVREGIAKLPKNENLEDHARSWVLCKDNQIRGVFLEDGRFFYEAGYVELMSEYIDNERELIRTTAAVLAKIL